jgi:hypothetical protein
MTSFWAETRVTALRAAIRMRDFFMDDSMRVCAERA